MALDLTSGPYGNAGADEAFWGEMAQAWAVSGVLKGKLLEFLVFADSSGRQVKVRTGWAWIQSQFCRHTTDNYVLPIVANSSGITRFDLVILRNDFTLNKITLTTKEGSVGVPPTLQNDAAACEIMLALVTVVNGAVTLAADTVVSMRSFSAPGTVKHHVKGSTANPSTTSLAVLAEMTLPIVTRGGDIEVDFSAAGSHSIAAALALFWVQLDAGSLIDIGGFTAPAANAVVFFGGKHRFVAPSAWRHTVTIWFQTSSGTLTMRAVNRTLDVEEVW